MKNILFAIIAVLIICIGILFYQVQGLKASISGDKNSVSSGNKETQTVSSPVVTGKLPDSKIAYINIDTLNERYLFISDYSKEINNKRLTLESQVQSASQKFQQDYEEAQQAAQAGIMPQNEMEAKKRDLEMQQREIRNKQIQMDNLVAKMEEDNDRMKRELKDFLKRFNNGKYDYILSYNSAIPAVLLANPSYDISNQVIEALNIEYKNKKATAKK